MNGFSFFQNRIIADSKALRRAEEIKEKQVLQKIDEIYALNDYEEESYDDLSLISFAIDYQGGQKSQLIIDDFKCMIKNFNNDLDVDTRDQVMLFYEPQD